MWGFLVITVLFLISCSTGIDMDYGSDQNTPTQGGRFRGTATVGSGVQFVTKSEHYSINAAFPISVKGERLESESFSVEVLVEK